MSRRILFSAEADRDVAASVTYYHQQQPGLEEKFLDEVGAVLRFIDLHSGGFQRLQGTLRQAPLERFPFVVIYAVSGDLSRSCVCSTRSNILGKSCCVGEKASDHSQLGPSSVSSKMAGPLPFLPRQSSSTPRSPSGRVKSPLLMVMPGSA